MAAGIVVRYVYSACVVTETPDARILHDPWFTEGIYDGAWYHFPKVADPLASIGDVDLIYVSHIHPDHYDPTFLAQYFARYGVKEVLIADHAPNHLAAKMRADGLAPTVLTGERRIGSTRLAILPHVTGSSSDIDSAIVIKYDDDARTHTVVNANDVIFDEPMRRRLKAAAGDVDILLCGFTGAGPYPQTYFAADDPRLPVEAERKKRAFFERYRVLTDTMEARLNIPFAGKYLLGGRLAPLNAFRGVADPTEMLARDPRACVLADDGGHVSTADLEPHGVRTEPYPAALVARRQAEIAAAEMDYERFIGREAIARLPLKRLLSAAARNAAAKSECEDDYYFCMRVPGGEYAVLNARRHSADTLRFERDPARLPAPRSELDVDPRYLFGLLTHVYHWNNAEVGSQIAVRRTPNTLHAAAQSYLHHLAV